MPYKTLLGMTSWLNMRDQFQVISHVFNGVVKFKKSKTPRSLLQPYHDA